MTRAALADEPPTARRVRPSKAAVAAALGALKMAGLPVDKVCISGGQIEIHCGPVDPKAATENDEGLLDW